MSEKAEPAEEAVHRGIRWRRSSDGDISFFDPDGSRWVDWAPGVDAPPRPPGWDVRPRRPRAGWRTPWRLVPVAVTVLVVVFALLQVSHPSGNQEKKETAATAALLGKCLAQHGELGGHAKYSATPVPCSSESAAAKVVAVIPSRPGSPPCPAGTTGFEIPYAGVPYPHVECLRQLHSAPARP